MVEMETATDCSSDDQTKLELLDLPDEILLYIIQLVGLNDALTSLSVQNHRLYNLCHDKSLWKYFDYDELVWTRSAFDFVFSNHGVHFEKLHFSKYSLMLANLTPLRYIEDTIGKCINLTHLDIHDTISIRSMSFLGSLPNLTYLNLSKCISVDPNTLPYITRCRKLEWLDLSNCEQFVAHGDAICGCLTSLEGLKVLNAERSFYIDCVWMEFFLAHLPLTHIALTPVYRPPPIWEIVMNKRTVSFGKDIDSLLQRYKGKPGIMEERSAMSTDRIVQIIVQIPEEDVQYEISLPSPNSLHDFDTAKQQGVSAHKTSDNESESIVDTALPQGMSAQDEPFSDIALLQKNLSAHYTLDKDLPLNFNLISDDSEIHSDADEETSIKETTDNSQAHIDPDTPVKDAPRGRKRVRNEENWAVNRRKRARVRGESYCARSGKRVKCREMGPACNCKGKCFNKIGYDQRLRIFNSFNSMADHGAQNAYLFGKVVQVPIKRRRSSSTKASRRDNTFLYHVCDGIQDVQVCKQAFLAIHGIKIGRVNHIIECKIRSPTPPADKRGKHALRANAISKNKLDAVRDHIRSFPTTQSHYSRKDNLGRRYLSSSLTIARMYDLYKAKCHENGVEYVKEHAYRRIFNTEFNLGFSLPKSDTCKTCDAFSASYNAADTDTKPSIKQDWNNHNEKANRAYDELKSDTLKAKEENSETIVISFDLQQALETPKVPTGVAFYLRQLWTYNFGVHNCGTDEASMYVWPENTAGRGSEEVISCLHSFVQERVPNTKTKLICYSDSCTGQNKNQMLVNYWMNLVSSGRFIKIEHKYLVPGHTYLPCDRDFALIEKRKRKVDQVYLPSGWVEVIKGARRVNPFYVKQMQREDFFSLHSRNTTNRKLSVKKEKVRFRDICWFDYKDDGYSYKYTFDGEWDTVDMTRRGRNVGKPSCNLKLKYEGPRPIPKKKYDDLMKLMPYIPEDTRSFYQSIKVKADDSDAEDDMD